MPIHNRINRNVIKRLQRFTCNISIVIMLVTVFAFFTIYNAFLGTNYLRMSNISVIINQACFLTIVGIGQALTILIGGIDLSVGSVMAFVTVLWGGMFLADSQVFPGLPIILILLTAALIGWINGVLITKLKIPAFITTFAVMYACRGFAWLLLANRVIYGLKPSVRFLGMGKIVTIAGFTITMPMLLVLIFLAGFAFLLKRTNFGRKVYFLGSNPVAAKFSGIRTDRLTVLIYTLAAVLAAFAGIMYVARLNSCEPGLATTTNFDSITVVLIGGFALAGGYGNIWGVFAGAIIVSTIQSGMNSIKLPSDMQTFVMGAIIIITVCFNSFLKHTRMNLSNDLENKETALISRVEH